MENEGLTRQAYKAIKNNIINGRLKPGQSIIETDLQEQLNFGRTPIREALQQLANEDLITIYPRKGMLVSMISPKKIKDIFEIREIIEPEILMKSGHLLDKKWLLTMKDEFTLASAKEGGERDISHYAALDDEFHCKIIQFLNNNYINSMMNSIFDYLTMIRLATNPNSDRYIASNNEHNDIIQLILEEKLKQASHSLKRHIVTSRKFTLDNYANSSR